MILVTISAMISMQENNMFFNKYNLMCGIIYVIMFTIMMNSGSQFGLSYWLIIICGMLLNVIGFIEGFNTKIKQEK